ncbi:T9SS type A sorting domain-containing protein, partial [Bacteroidota bacterium]
LLINDNVYDNANDIINKRNAFNRERWFYEQRMYPYNFIPVDAYKNAIEQRDQLRITNGFYNDNSNNWVNIGPTSGYYFSYGNISSRIVTISYDPNNPNILYLGAAFGGVWKSTNGGVNWTSKTDYEVSLSSGSIAIDPNNSNIVYYGTGEATYSGASYYGRGLLKSTNGGNTWTNYSADLPSLTYTSRIVVRPNHSNELLAAMGNAGLFRSTNAGVNWSIVAGGRCDDVVFSPTGDTAYIVGSGTGYRISINGGSTFTFYSVATLGTRNHLAICKSSPNILYLSKYASGNISVYKSINAGYNFTQVSTGTNFNGGQAWYDFYMHVNPFDPNYAYVGSIDIWRTTNGGTSFQNITNGYSGGNVHVDQHNLAFHPTDANKMFSANDGGVWYSTNRGSNWSNMNSSLTLTQFYRIAADPSNAAHVMGGTQDNGTQRTLGTINWTGAFGGDGGEVSFHSQNSQYILGETQNNGVRRSLNGGSSWSSATNGLSGSGAWVGPIIPHPDSSDIFYTARQSIFKTTNVAASWFSISTGTAGTIRELAICKSNPNIMYATSSSRVYRSTNRGYTFTLVSSGMPNRTVTSVYAHPDSSNVALVTFSGFGAGKVYKTTNGGSSWNNISGNLPDSPTNDVLIYHPGYATSVYLAAMDVGVFMTNNYGNTWVELAQGLPNTVAIHLDYNQTANKVRIGTHGRGVYEISGLVTGIVNMNNQIPKKYSLSQNYPNPFNPSTLIRFTIMNDKNVRLKVYDLLGKEITTLVNKRLITGTYDVNFDGSRINSGIYIYRIETDNFSDSKKMILIK